MHVDTRMTDRLTGIALLALGVAMLVGGYTMDRLEIRQIHPASIPGLVPMGLGVALVICALALILSSKWTSSTAQTSASSTGEQPGSYKNLLITAVLSVGYAGVLIGKIPFLAATACYIFSFSVYFTWPEKPAELGVKLKQIALIAIFAVVFATGISALFQYGFLVRLP